MVWNSRQTILEISSLWKLNVITSHMQRKLVLIVELNSERQKCCLSLLSLMLYMELKLESDIEIVIYSQLINCVE